MALPSLTECAAALDHLAPALLNAAAGSVVVLGSAGAAALILRRASAAARHRAWLLGFAGVLLLPVLSAILPGWHVLPRLGVSGRTSRADGVARAEVVLAPSVMSLAMPSPLAAESSTHRAKPVSNTSTKSELPSAEPAQAPVTLAAPAPLQLTPSASPAARPGPAREARTASLPWTDWLLLCWALGILLVLGHVLLGYSSLWLLRRRCVAVTQGGMFELLERLREDAGVRRPVELLSSPVRTMPMTWGLWRARLLVPEQAETWPPGQRRDVLLHELGHVKRCDCLTQLLAQVACAVYWFNPMAWIASRRMQIERERACDDLVLNSGAEASSYARHLLHSVSSVPALRLVGAAVAMARVSTLEERMRAILDRRLNRRAVTVRGSLAMALLLMSTLLPVAVLKAQQGPEGPATEPPGNGIQGPSAPPAREGRDGRDAPSALPTSRPTGRPQPSRSASPAPRFGGSGVGSAAVPNLGEGPTCLLDATIYDVRLPADRIGRLDVDALANAAETAETFEKALAALGTAKPLYRASQSVRLSGDNVTISSEVPMVTNTQVGVKGEAINTIQYQSVGAMFALAGKVGATGPIDLDLTIQVTASSGGGVPISDNVMAPVFRRAALSHKGPVKARKPFLVVSVDAGSVDKDGKAVAYIGRIKMGEPQSPLPK